VGKARNLLNLIGFGSKVAATANVIAVVAAALSAACPARENSGAAEVSDLGYNVVALWKTTFPVTLAVLDLSDQSGLAY